MLNVAKIKVYISVVVFYIYMRMNFHDFVEFANTVKIKPSHKVLILQYVIKILQICRYKLTVFIRMTNLNLF